MTTDVKKLKLVIYPDPVLRRQAKPVARITAEVRAVAQRMLEIMHEARGVGLAAPQVGLAWRLFVANPTGLPEDDRVFINPLLGDLSKELADREEGCLSLPEVTGIIRRPKIATVAALGLDDEPFVMTSDELAARVWQHETDHLDGVLIIDKMTPLDRLANQKKLRELEAQV